MLGFFRRDVVLTFYEAKAPVVPGVSGYLWTPASISNADLERIKSWWSGKPELVDGQVVKI
jgi:hypothetical protein